MFGLPGKIQTYKGICIDEILIGGKRKGKTGRGATTKMATSKTDILVYGTLGRNTGTETHGTLSAHQGKGRKSFSFQYDPDWLRSKEHFLLDPDIGWYSGPSVSGQERKLRCALSLSVNEVTAFIKLQPSMHSTEKSKCIHSCLSFLIKKF